MEQYAFVLHDYDLIKLSRPSRNRAPRRIKGLPETVSLKDKTGFVKLTPDIQWAWFRWNELLNQNPLQNQNDFRSLTASDRAFTNRFGSDKCACYPCNANLDKEPMRYFPLLCGGAYIKIVGGLGTKLLAFETMSSTEDLSVYHPLSHPHLFFRATNSIREEIWKNGKWTGKYIENKVISFHQFQYQAIVPILARGAKVNYVEAAKVRLLPPGSPIPSPFVY